MVVRMRRVRCGLPCTASTSNSWRTASSGAVAGVGALVRVEDGDRLEYVVRGGVRGLGELEEEPGGQPFHAGNRLDRPVGAGVVDRRVEAVPRGPQRGGVRAVVAADDVKLAGEQGQRVPRGARGVGHSLSFCARR